ncbi:MAG: DIP1984 family protein [Anaerolineae bacterium]|nr:DIP1984 family protein [Anaerolineae bacterium]
MKLAEALILRADTQKRLLQLRERLVRNARVQEGDAPAEAPDALLAEYRRVLGEFTVLVQRINHTNAVTTMADGGTLTDALAQRDAFVTERAMLNGVVEQASSLTSDWRYGRSEIKFVPTVSVADLQQQADRVSRDLRELDVIIQQTNWQVDVVDGSH